MVIQLHWEDWDSQGDSGFSIDEYVKGGFYLGYYYSYSYSHIEGEIEGTVDSTESYVVRDLSNRTVMNINWELVDGDGMVDPAGIVDRSGLVFTEYYRVPLWMDDNVFVETIWNSYYIAVNEPVPFKAKFDSVAHGFRLTDASGNASPNVFDNVPILYNGMAPAVQNGLAGYIDERGNIVIPFQFEHAGLFVGDLAPVRQNGVWGFIDRQGRTVVEDPSWTGAGAYSHGHATVQTDEGVFIIRINR
jgi:hypothetical protein